MNIKYQKLLAALGATLFLQACASDPDSTVWLKPAGEIGSVSAKLEGVDREVDSKVEAGSKGVALGAAAAAGVGAAGAATGAIYGMACGPLYFACSPAGAVVGGVIGVVAGFHQIGHEERVSGISADKAELFNDLSGQYFNPVEIDHNLHEDFVGLIEKNWSKNSASSNAIELEVQKIYFIQAAGENIRLASQANLKFSVDGEVVTRVLTEQGEFAHVDYWLVDGGKNIGIELDRLLARLLNNSASLLAGQHWAPDLTLLEEDHEIRL